MATVFEHFLEFPEEVRIVVINEMEPDDRCRFTRCSKSSQKEAQKCKNYIYGIKLYAYLETSINFSVMYHEQHDNTECGDCNMLFLEGYDGNKHIVYSNRLGVQLWKTQLDSSKSIMEYACDNFKNMLNIHQRTIKKLWMRNTGDYDFEIRSLSNLESLTLGGNTDIRQIMSKIRKPLKEFEYRQRISERFTKEFEQICVVQNLLRLDRTHLNYEQFQNLSAQKINMNIGNLTEEDVSDFIQSWKNDKIRQNFISCQWYITGSRFDVQKLFRLLRIHQSIEKWQRWTNIDISHNKNAAKKAELGFDSLRLEFRVLIQ